MPPKKGAKGKDGPAKFADKENLARAETEVLNLQRLLELRSYEVRLWLGPGPSREGARANGCHRSGFHVTMQSCAMPRLSGMVLFFLPSRAIPAVLF